MRQSFVALMLILLFAVGNVFATDEDVTDPAQIRLVNLTDDMEAIRLRMDWDWVVLDIAQGDTSPFANFPVGDYTAEIVRGSNTVTTTSITLEAGSLTTLIALGSREADTLRVVVVDEDTSELLPAISNVTLVQTWEEGAVDVYANARPWAQALSADAATLSVSTGLYDVSITRAADRNAELSKIRGIHLEGTQRYLLIVAGTSAEPLVLLASERGTFFNSAVSDELMADEGPAFDGPTANVRFVHLSERVASLDFYRGEERIGRSIGYMEASEFVQVPTGSQTFYLTQASAGLNRQVVEPIAVNLQTDSFLSVMIVGSVSDASLRAVTFTENIGSIYDLSAAITFVHALEGQESLDIYRNHTKLVEALHYPDDSHDGATNIRATAGDFQFDFTLAFDRDAVIFRAVDLELAGDTAYLIALTGRLNDPTLVIMGPEGVQTRRLRDLPPEAHPDAASD